MKRSERLAQIKALQARGLTRRQIAEQMGCAIGTVYATLNDPDGAKQRANRRRWEGVCVDCGGPTKYAGHKDGYTTSTRCIYCAQNRPRPRVRLCVPVRLPDIPVEVRLDGASDASRACSTEDERLEVLLAAISPSNRIYWVAESARPLVEQWRAA